MSDSLHLTHFNNAKKPRYADWRTGQP